MISIVCPFYNEALGVGAFFSRLIPVLDRLEEAYEVICVNDGSRDGTLAALLAMRALHPSVRVIDLSRNFGKEVSLSAGRLEGSAQNAFQGPVIDVTPLSDRLRVLVDVGVVIAADVTREAAARLELAPGRQVWASVKATAVRVYG